MNYQELTNVEKAVYLLKGDAFLCKQTKNKIAQLLKIENINISQFNEENFEALSVVNACNQFSFFEENRMVVVQDLQKELNSESKKILENYCKNPNLTCTLVLIDTISSNCFDFIKQVELVECKANETFLINYIKEQFEKNKKEISQSLCKKILENCLSNLNRINLEIKKICDYLQAETIVSEQVVDLLVFKDIELKVFDLTTALGYKNKDKALKLVHSMLELGEPPIKIISLIAGQFRRMFFAKLNKGSNAELAKVLGCKEFAIIKAKEQAIKFSASELKKIENMCMEVDFNIKNGDMSMENSLYYLIFNIINAS
ncbi:MAG: DNA polymerase III subunit delta [Clostridiales bacterium]|nr:DNA polymerase III subunit delta [Clostridiales bacterium]